MNRWIVTVLVGMTIFFAGDAFAKKERPKHNMDKNLAPKYVPPAGLAFGGQFLDRYEPVPLRSPLTRDTWGAENVLPRDVANGIEDPDWSYWGGKILKGDDGKYHMFPCRWPEDAKRGHRNWMNSMVVHAVADHPLGPYQYKETVGPGHNPCAYRLSDGSYAIYCYTKAFTYHYRAREGLDGPWTISGYQYDLRDRPGAYLNASNFSILQREDGSCLAVDKKGTMLVSQTGLSQWIALGTGRVYPKHPDPASCFEDPEIWYDGIQYHMITHNYPLWQAYYLRSKDGVHWVKEPGLAYGKATMVYEDGTQNEWYRFERVMVLQDDLGRAMQINFAATDVDKDAEKGNDNHNSKNMCIPLVVGRQLELLNKELITVKTREIRVRVHAEEGFDPQTDMQISSLRFGAAQEVNFGRGCRVVKTEKSGADLILVFNGKGNGFNAEHFAGKLLGKTASDKLLFGWSRLPGVDYVEPLLSAWPPVVTTGDSGTEIQVQIGNFGQVASDATAQLDVLIDNQNVASSSIAALKPFERTTLTLKGSQSCPRAQEITVTTKLTGNGTLQEAFESKVVVGGRY